MKTDVNKSGTTQNLGITEYYDVDTILQKNRVNVAFPYTCNQYFIFSDFKKAKMTSIQGKRILKFLEKELRKILHE